MRKVRARPQCADCVKVYMSITRPAPLAVWPHIVGQVVSLVWYCWARSEPGMIAGSNRNGGGGGQWVQIQYHWPKEHFVQALCSFLSSEAKAQEATALWDERNYIPGWGPVPSEWGGWRKRKSLWTNEQFGSETMGKREKTLQSARFLAGNKAGTQGGV